MKTCHGFVHETKINLIADMLAALRIKNLALVSDLTFEPKPGLNVITGETGAGKSIIIGALNLLVGGRAGRHLIRDGEETCMVEGVFELRDKSLLDRIQVFLNENGLESCEEGQLILKRSLGISGGNRQFVNGSPATMAQLALLGDWLLDIHGPHDHQSLLHPNRQLAILDAYGGLEFDRVAFGKLVTGRRALERQKAELGLDEEEMSRQVEMLRFQVEEIKMARLKPGEDVDLAQEHQRVSQSARLMQITSAALLVLGESDDSLFNLSGILGKHLADLARIDPQSSHLASNHAQVSAGLRDLQMELGRYADRLETNPARLAELEERINLLHTLQRKYGRTLEQVMATGEEAERRLALLEGRDLELERLNKALSDMDAELVRAGDKLSQARKKTIPDLVKAISRQLQGLGFKQSRLEIQWNEAALARQNSPSEWGEHGYDSVEFMFTPNPGEMPKPLRAIASSGEMARVMLALKTALAAQDEIPVLVFDEVDANVGGETARAVGEKMKKIAARRQVFCISHLPQVAAAADAHFVVSKQVKNGRTVSEMKWLDKPMRVTEVARMLGGQSEASRKHAEALLA